ncbi:helix-turn-helix domain-containing protein [Streptomyces sp. ISL-22]|uniref:helix-turn-helix domain-containing protein n=1 Tax=Streptomyces sp. ISL-22 TaxID=2819180 RepID=UPI0027E37196|nr:helix-turn-helix domain-containing protein [Streptomyces sp. ISL-22]
MFAVGARATLFADSGACHVTRHRSPAWKLVLPIGGHAVLRPDGGPVAEAPGLVVPPRLAHTCAASSAYAALFVDPWLLPRAPGPIRLDAGTVRRLLTALGPTGVDGPSPVPDLDAAYAELLRHTGRPRALDPRVAHAVRALRRPGHATPLDTVASEVGLSPPRLRALVRASVGIPLSTLRQWARLRDALTAPPGTPLADAAADAGFADQAHLTRTARALVGRTPGSLRPRHPSRVASSAEG